MFLRTFSYSLLILIVIAGCSSTIKGSEGGLRNLASDTMIGDDNIIRHDSGNIYLMKWEKAKNSCPKGRGLPTTHQLANMAKNFKRAPQDDLGRNSFWSSTGTVANNPKGDPVAEKNAVLCVGKNEFQ